MLLPSFGVPGEVFSSCGVGTPVLFHDALCAFCWLISIYGLKDYCLVVVGASSLDLVYEIAPL